MGVKPVQIVICEDISRDMEVTLDLCDRYAAEHGYDMDLLPYGSAEKLLSDPAVRQADVLMLDIMMEGPNGPHPAGVEIARTLRREGYAGAIIFTTDSSEYYPEGFEVSAMHYLIKPLSYEAVSEALDRAVRQILKPQRVITVPVNRIQVTIATRTIRYAEVYGRETMLHTTTEPLRVLLPLKRIEELLHGDPFLHCYRSYIINMDFVQSLEDDHFRLTGGTRIPITMRNRQSIRERYFAYKLSKQG